MQYKIENETLIPAPLNFRTPEGATICNFSASPELMTRYGYTLTEAEAEAWRQAHPAPKPRPAVRTRCTKYELVTVLREHFAGLYYELRERYEADPELRFFWSSVTELDRDNADFFALAEKAGLTSTQIAEIFARLPEA